MNDLGTQQGSRRTIPPPVFRTDSISLRFVDAIADDF
jgi:hypothetical protein